MGAGKNAKKIARIEKLTTFLPSVSRAQSRKSSQFDGRGDLPNRLAYARRESFQLCVFHSFRVSVLPLGR